MDAQSDEHLLYVTMHVVTQQLHKVLAFGFFCLVFYHMSSLQFQLHQASHINFFLGCFFASSTLLFKFSFASLSLSLSFIIAHHFLSLEQNRSFLPRTLINFSLISCCSFFFLAFITCILQFLFLLCKFFLFFESHFSSYSIVIALFMQKI